MHGLLVLSAALVAGACVRALRRPFPRSPAVIGPAPSRSARRRHVALAVALAVIAVTTGPGPALLTVGVGAASARLHALSRDRRRAREIAGALPDAMELLVLLIHAGRSPSQAVLDARPHLAPVVRPAFDAVDHRLQRGQRFADAITALSDHLGSGAAGAVDAIAAAERYGLPLAPVLERLASKARSDRRRAADAAARTLPVRLSFPLVVCTLPSFVLLAIVPAVLGTISSLRGHAP